ncbi:maltokinase N-terminal cap-like domain-containing protein [Actinomadura harenae]|uniref:1,4-alpha-glucan branching protein n=1 Tax=Actinomadura harenae TaxID=2483351 RepID=A0A3M2LND8_9ACTN|nr:1,4-alpha-glucan branching protein [Actinomadura harenae]RMI37595.1 1,4-alpha-glucan branching protein [Actinomadura harenae]
MAVMHETELKPSKLELLALWLPAQSWYRGGDEPELADVGGFRLDDPEGEVGIEFKVIIDSSGTRPTTYLVPLTYRGAPLDGAEDALVGTMEHGVLGRRWAYDGCHDPVMVGQLLALIEGRVQAQDQHVSDTPHQDVTRDYTGGPLDPEDFAGLPVDDDESTELRASQGTVLRLQRVLYTAPHDATRPPAGTTGHLTGSWRRPDGVRPRAFFAFMLASREN